MFSARVSSTQDEIVLEASVDDTKGVFHLRMSADESRRLRERMQEAERELAKRQNARGDHPLF